MDILERIYPKVSRLEDFLRGLDGCPPLYLPKDKAGYKAFLHSTLVGIPSSHVYYKGPLDYTQHSDHMEVINRVMRRLQRQGRSGKNVILNGFSSWRSEGDCAGNIDVPNNNVDQLKIPFWRKLLSRIGDELMMHILENLSIFAAAPPSCYIQLTGFPVSLLISSTPSNTSPIKLSMKEGKSCQFEDEKKVRCKRQRGEREGHDEGNAKFLKTEQGAHRIHPREDRSYCILNACYSKRLGHSWSRHDFMSVYPASNSGAQRLTRHIFSSSCESALTSGKSDAVTRYLVKGRDDDGIQGDNKVKKRKKLQRTCRRLIKVQNLLKTLLAQHRKLNLKSILNHQCPMNIPQESNTKKVSATPPPSSESVSSEKSLIELRNESQQEGYSPKVFQRKKPHRRVPGNTQLCGVGISNNSCSVLLTQSHHDTYSQRKIKKKTERPFPSDATAPNATAKSTISDSMQSRVKKIRRCKVKTGKGKRLPDDAATLIKMQSDPWQVCLFLRQVLLKAVRYELWGSVHNRNVFFKGVKKFVGLGRFERLSLRELTEEIRAEDCEWAQLEKFKGHDPPFTSVVKQRQLVTDFFHWLMVGYTIPLIMMCFYVTETASSRNQLIFYRTPVWILLEKIGIQNYVANGVMKPIEEGEVMKRISTGQTLGISRLRFIPKTKSLRPITRMGKSVISEKKGLSVRLLLQDLFDVLSFHKVHEPSMMGSSLLGIDGIYNKVLKFIQDRKERNDTRPLYFVKVDIEKCYDSIKHRKLLQIISMLLQGQDKPDEYFIQRYMTVTKAASTSSGLQKMTHRRVTTEMSIFHRQLIEMAKRGQMKNAIIINKVHTVKVTPKELLHRLEQHVTSDIVKLMMRLIDDFLLVTPHLNKAQRFLHLLLSGVEQYGCSANPTKTLVNFDFMFNGQMVPRSTELFPWCGIVFNTQTLNISNDYTKYDNISIRYTLTMNKDAALHNMRTKLIWSLKAKNVSIFMDPLINSFRTIVVNVYHLLLLLGYRFHSYYHCLANCIQKNTRPLQFYNMWASCVRIFHDYVISKLRRDNREDAETTFPLTINTVNWIGLKAFETKLSQHRGSYHPIIKLVKTHRRKAAQKMGKAMLGVIEDMTNPDLPVDFKKMRR
ncbi:telomerase reverse transcriptase-like isoform X2 [Lytechinus variegatus]|uniref:telomerase reverse transcriptase-like isoform X2 n=1 Tax=Lytechinus variegatus TaxID=7654 RepID=UPI001BB1C220|nr:telomerase reverse transcriptase-like isoform X2 [Lytechinus variegatus]